MLGINMISVVGKETLVIPISFSAWMVKKDFS